MVAPSAVGFDVRERRLAAVQVRVEAHRERELVDGRGSTSAPAAARTSAKKDTVVRRELRNRDAAFERIGSVESGRCRSRSCRGGARSASDTVISRGSLWKRKLAARSKSPSALASMPSGGGLPAARKIFASAAGSVAIVPSIVGSSSSVAPRSARVALMPAASATRPSTSRPCAHRSNVRLVKLALTGSVRALAGSVTVTSAVEIAQRDGTCSDLRVRTRGDRDGKLTELVTQLASRRRRRPARRCQSRPSRH